MTTTKSRGRRGINGKGPFLYRHYFDNCVIWPGRRPALDKFLGQRFKGSKTYGKAEDITEVDLSFEGDGFLVLVEAKLYSPMSQALMVNAIIRSLAS